MLGDTCTGCQKPKSDCSCSKPAPCLPGPDNPECEIWVPFKCVFWTGDDIPGTPIKKGTPLNTVVTYLLSRITALETP